MRPISALFAPLALVLAGCSVYPLPEDVTGFNSEDIVRITRCQAREGVRDEIQRALTFPPIDSQVVYHGMTGSQMAAWLRASPERYRHLRIGDFTPQIRRLYLFYGDLQISYDFTIDSSEMNSAGFDLSLLKGFTSGSNLFEVSAKHDRTREVKLQTRHYDSFDSLARGLEENYCAGLPTTINPIYPAAGLTKVKSVIRQFVNDNQSDNLGSKDSAVNAESNTTITFTTKTSGNFDPVLNANAVTGVYTPTVAKVTSDNYRLDVHTIIVLVQLPDKRDKLVVFDRYGDIVAVGAGLISSARADQKFEEIRRNNYQDQFGDIARGLEATNFR